MQKGSFTHSLTSWPTVVFLVFFMILNPTGVMGSQCILHFFSACVWGMCECGPWVPWTSLEARQLSGVGSLLSACWSLSSQLLCTIQASWLRRRFGWPSYLCITGCSSGRLRFHSQHPHDDALPSFVSPVLENPIHALRVLHGSGAQTHM